MSLRIVVIVIAMILLIASTAAFLIVGAIVSRSCPFCGEEAKPTDEYCRSCGKILDGSKLTCPECNEIADPDDNFCHKCGHKIIE